MSIQLDGRVTYPYERDDEDEPAEDGPCEGPSPANFITWDGFWHYSQKQPRGGNDLCHFKYCFVGPADLNDPSLAPNPAAPEAISEARGSSVGGPRRTTGPSSGRATGDGAAPTTARHNSSISSTEGEKSKSSATTPGDCSFEAGEEGRDGGDLENKMTMALATYGPRGEGRLPSGKWKGHFIVKYSRGVEVKVEEAFVLEFGSKSQRRPITPSSPAGTQSSLYNGNQPATSEAGAASLTGEGGRTATGAALVSHPATSGSSSIVAPTGIPVLALSGEVPPVAPSAAPAAVPTTFTTDAATATAVGCGVAGSLAEPASAMPAPVSAAAAAASEAGEVAPPTLAAGAQAAAAVTLVLSRAPAPIAPVVRVSGWGENKYGQFTLTGGHERATGRLDLTRFYYEKPRETGRSSGDRAGSGGSHHRRRRPQATSSILSPPRGSSIAERRTKRARHPNQRLLDDEGLVSHTSHTESANNSGGGGGGAGSAMAKRKASGEVQATSESSSTEPGGGSGVTAGISAGSVTTKTRKPRDREHDLLMERARRSKKKETEARKAVAVHNKNDLGARAPLSACERAAAESMGRVEEQREVLAALEAAETDDPVFEQLHRDTIASMKERLTTLEAEAATAAAAAAAETAANAEVRGAMLMDEAVLTDHNGSWRVGGGEGGTGGKRGGGRSRRASVERWEEMTADPETQECYEGGWVRGRRHGKGICVYADRRIYEGEWRAGREHGWGKIMEEDRRVLYEGELADGKLYGKGRYTDGSGAVYDGEWKDNAMHGRGVYTFTVGENRGGGDGGGVPGGTMIYDGEFRDNARCGRGVQTWPGGSYDGEWLDNARHGRGILRTDDGFVYDGQWVDDLPEGRGICIHPDGQRYEGVFRGGKKEGRGTLAFPNGASYEGRFRDDAIDGQGMLHIPKPVEDHMGGWMIPIQFQSDIERIHVKAGFDKVGL